MDDETYNKMEAGLRASMRKYPKCRVASCECDDSAGEWKVGCNCPGHWQAMDTEFGEGGWSLGDAVASSKVGKPVRQ